MKVESLLIPDIKVIYPTVFTDERGEFFESWQLEHFQSAGLPVNFMQDNQSVSKKHVIRGLHFQNPPFAQGKLVRVAKGAVLDVAVDIRKASPTYGKWVSQVLSQSNCLIMWIPPGFAHGFLALEDDAVFLYKCTALYNRESEQTICWDDPDLAIDWGCQQAIISDKDRAGIKFCELNSLF